MIAYMDEADSFYRESLRGGKWKIFRAPGCGEQECYRIFYEPSTGVMRSQFAWEANLTTGYFDPWSEYAKTIQNELRRKGAI